MSNEQLNLFGNQEAASDSSSELIAKSKRKPKLWFGWIGFFAVAMVCIGVIASYWFIEQKNSAALGDTGAKEQVKEPQELVTEPRAEVKVVASKNVQRASAVDQAKLKREPSVKQNIKPVNSIVEKRALAKKPSNSWRILVLGNQSLGGLLLDQASLTRIGLGQTERTHIVDPRTFSSSQSKQFVSAFFETPKASLPASLNFSKLIQGSERVSNQKPVPRPKRVLLYALNNISSDVITSVNLAKDVGQLRVHGEAVEGDELSQISLSGGFPIWIKRELIEKSSDRSSVLIVARMANALSSPSSDKGTKLGVLMHGEKFKIIRTDKEWVRVWSPPSFRAWAKTDDLMAIQDLR